MPLLGFLPFLSIIKKPLVVVGVVLYAYVSVMLAITLLTVDPFHLLLLLINVTLLVFEMGYCKGKTSPNNKPEKKED